MDGGMQPADHFLALAEKSGYFLPGAVGPRAPALPCSPPFRLLRLFISKLRFAMSLPPPRRPLRHSDSSSRRKIPAVRTSLPDGSPPVYEERSLGKLIRSILAPLLILGCLGALVWFYTGSLEKNARAAESIKLTMRAVAAEIWDSGSVAGLPLENEDLSSALIVLRNEMGGVVPQILVAEADGAAVDARTTHQVAYLTGKKMVLTLGVFFDPNSGKLEVLNFEPGSEYRQAVADWLKKKATSKKAAASGPESKPQPSSLGL